MDIDINYALAYYTTNVNIYEFHWKSYGHAVWYDTRIESYGDAMNRIKDIVWAEIFLQNPHIVGTEIKFIESGEMPIIDINNS
jgi:hypothetical protein